MLAREAANTRPAKGKSAQRNWPSDCSVSLRHATAMTSLGLITVHPVSRSSLAVRADLCAGQLLVSLMANPTWPMFLTAR
jgi:hypothetical protein